ncbi:MAG: hypothetical protein H7Y43_00590 [Akkermansiaceae bacterium]|nr:hypothetical protein [Verrucomicrobiales bacterium]
MGAALGVEERAAQKRVARSLEKLRAYFVRRGVIVSVTVLGSVVSANSIQAAPGEVIFSTIAAVKGGGTSTPGTQAIVKAALKWMLLAKLKFACGLGIAALVAGAMVTAVEDRQADVAAPLPDTFSLEPAPSALIVVGLIPEDAPEPLDAFATETRRVLIQRGLGADRVVVMSGKVTREQVLAKLREFSRSVKDEFWLVLCGHSSRSQGGVPAFQVSGPRLTGADLKLALDDIPGRQFVFIGTGNGGGFLPELQDTRRTVLSATRAQGEPDQPRFLAAWVKELAADSKAPFAVIAARAAAAVDAEYARSNMAQSEHAQLADPTSGQILQAPFGVISNAIPVIEPRK